MPGAEGRTDPLAKIGGGPSRDHGDLTVGTANLSFLRRLKKAQPLRRVPLGNLTEALEEGFLPPDFGGAHRSGPRPHMPICLHYFMGPNPRNSS